MDKNLLCHLANLDAHLATLDLELSKIPTTNHKIYFGLFYAVQLGAETGKISDLQPDSIKRLRHEIAERISLRL